MEISFKIKIEKNQEFSLIIEKLPELAGLLKNLTHVLKAGCHGVVIKKQAKYFQVSSFEGAAALSILKTFIEAVYIKFTGYEDAEEQEFKNFRQRIL